MSVDPLRPHHASHAVHGTVLVSAYGCEPGKGSEQGVGWNWLLQLATVANLVVITRTNNRPAIEAELGTKTLPHIELVYYALPAFDRAWQRRERGLHLYYLAWQWGAYRLATAQLSNTRLDYVMHLTFGSIWLPTFMHRLGPASIWGPPGGGESVPWPLVRSLCSGRLLQYARHLLIPILPMTPFFSGPARKAVAILARTNDTARALPAFCHCKTTTVLETAASQDWFSFSRAEYVCRLTEPVRVVYTGRLAPLKNLTAAFHAVARAKANGVLLHFTIVGEGPSQPRLIRLVRLLGLDASVSFLGRCPQDKVFELLASSDIYLFPSLKEGGVGSLKEAMSLGLPCVCVKTTGMEVIADSSCARLVETTTPDQMIDDFSSALVELAASPLERRRLGENAQKRMEQNFRWEQKADVMRSLLTALDGGRSC